MLYIGIDPGVNTGLVVWDDKKKKFIEVDTLSIHRAMDRIKTFIAYNDVFIIFEDARQRKYLPMERNRSEQRGKLMGAGSIKRDCSIWEDFLTDYDIPFRAVPPQKGGTKWDERYFKMVTGWKGKTSNHARDAAVLVFGK